MKQNRLVTILCLLLMLSIGYNIGLWLRFREAAEINYWISGSEYRQLKAEIHRLETQSKDINQ